ncbi:MAG TPA: SGNH/GDSL hydrolase family protein [Mobilitalea sp.]|nr:SGNH/GDSL hydrolase family protein [Mobilitalea sp.]
MTNTTTFPSATISPMEKVTPAAVTHTPEETILSEKEYIPSEEYVKQLGRTYLLGDTLWLAFSAAGADFTFTGTKAVITLKGDNIAIAGMSQESFCRYGIYVNDELVADELLKEPEKTITVYESDVEKTVTVRVLKLSEAANSTIGIGKIQVTAKEPIKPTAAKSHRIEFVGDSITCGFGVDDSDVNGEFTTAMEVATKAYAYNTAQALDADYSLVCLSGYGIISGYTANGMQNASQIIPPYYDKIGFSYGYFNSTLQVSTLDWDFSRFVPELIVVNLGTNDNSYCGNDADKQEEYVKGYVEFLKQIRANNPDAAILCTLGMMGDTLYPSVEKAVSSYTQETGDTRIYSMKFDVQQASDGYGACWHPSEVTHQKAADKLTARIKTIMGW